MELRYDRIAPRSRTATHCNTLQHTIAHCNTATQSAEAQLISEDATRKDVLQCVAVCCRVLQCVAVCCSVLQCVAVCCSEDATRKDDQNGNQNHQHKSWGVISDEMSKYAHCSTLQHI